MSPAKKTSEEKSKDNISKKFHELVAALNDDNEFSIRAARLHEAWERAQQSKEQK